MLHWLFFLFNKFAVIKVTKLSGKTTIGQVTCEQSKHNPNIKLCDHEKKSYIFDIPGSDCLHIYCM